MTRSVICDMVCATLLCTCLLGAPAFAQSPAQPLAQAEHPVFAAVQRGDISALERLLKESRDKRLANARNAEGEPLLYVAAESGSVDLVGVVGYYAMIAMLMNVARTAPPSGLLPLAALPQYAKPVV